MKRVTKPYVWTPPKNETKEHFLLKQIGRLWLYENKCRYVATEVYVYGCNDEYSKKKYIDACGVDKNQEVSYGVEAKVSRADFNNGYCSRCNYTYVIVPKGLLTKDDTPSYVGIIEVDIPNFRFIRNAKTEKFVGLNVLKKSKYHINRMYIKSDNTINEDMMFANTQKLCEYINRSNMNELIFNTNLIPMETIVQGSRRYK